MSAQEHPRAVLVRSSVYFRAAVLALLCSVALAYALIPSRVAEFANHDPLHRWDDFGIFFSTAGCLSSGSCDPYPATPRPFPNLNPPHFHWLLTPLVGMDVETAYRLWLLMSVAAVALSALRTVRALGIAVSPLTAVGGAFALLVSSVSWGTITYGQVYAVLMWPVTEAWLSARSSRWHRAAALLTAVATVKPLLLLPLAWLVWLRPRTLATAAAVAVLVFGSGSVVHGIDAYRGWYQDLGTVEASGSWANGSISAALARTFISTPWFRPTIAAPFLVWPLWIMLSLLLVFDLSSWSRRASADAAWLGALAAAFLISPRAWMYSAWLLVGPVMAVALRARWRAPEILFASALLMLPVELTRVGQPNAVLTLLNGSIYTWALGLLYVAARKAITFREAPANGTERLHSER
ncbi:MAG: glycosyltransferase family 87 protein [Vicinamibacterales bacterium]